MNMVSRTKFLQLCTGLLPILLGVLALGGLLLGPQPTFAADNCIQDVWAAHGNTQSLTCTANDVSVANVTNIKITSGGSCDANGVCTCTSAATPPTNCSTNPNQLGCVTFEADYEILLTAQTRYDIGLYFGVDGDPNGNGALTGQCSNQIILPGEENGTVFTNLDNPNNANANGDLCGDIINNTKTVSNNNPQILKLTVSTACVGDSDGHLKLPNCTSWRTSGQNDTCKVPFDAYPGAPSKCNCQPGFTIDIFVETASVEVTNTASPTHVPETGGTVTYTVTMKNKATQVSLTINSISDDIYGDLGDANNAAVTNNTCPSLIGTSLAAGATTSCTFDAFVSGNSGDTVTDIATVCGTDSQGHTGLCGFDDATVDIDDVAKAPTIAKTAQSASCQVDVTYQVVVSNTSAIDTLTVNSLNDDKFGDITTTHAAGGGFEQVVTACSLSQNPIPVSGNANCTFVGRITSSDCSIAHTNTVTGSATDSDGVTTDGTSTPPLKDSATVNVTVTFP
jgi:hypothetical protein